MFELIGMAFVAWVVWVVGKAMLRIFAKTTMQQAVHSAAGDGVPVGSALEILDQPELVTAVRRELAAKDASFNEPKLHEQYGSAIAAIHEAQTAKVDDFKAVAEKVESLLAPQVAQLAAAWDVIEVSDVTFAYVQALAMNVTKNPVSLGQTKAMLEHALRDELFDITQAWTIVQHSSDFMEKVAALMPIARSEVAAGGGDYFVRLTRAVAKYLEDPLSFAAAADFDPRKSSKAWYLEV
ncbi:hypothetical protein GCM10028813_01370 [Ramlibacter alkalitolerans]